MGFPKTLLEFQEQFPDEDGVLEGAAAAALASTGSECPRLRHIARAIQSPSGAWSSASAAATKRPMTAGTVFHKTRVPLRIWFLGHLLRGAPQAGHLGAPVPARYRVSAATRRPGPCCTSFARRSGTGPSIGCGAGSRPDETYVGSKRERGLRGGREVGHKTIVGVAVEQRRHNGGFGPPGRARGGDVRRRSWAIPPRRDRCATKPPSARTASPPTFSSKHVGITPRPPCCRARIERSFQPRSFPGATRSSRTSRLGSWEPSEA